ncbi:MAG TPA: DUF1553 domain-containing protein [Pirellulales bacterium]|nr:DUF1553 domain-containing protein [Pirellulales bacterium]
MRNLIVNLVAPLVVAIPLLCGAVSTARAADSASSIEVSPSAVTLDGPRDRVQLVVSAKKGDFLRDVTREVRWGASDACAVIDAQGSVRPLSEGTTELIGELGDETIRVPVTVGGTSQARPVSFPLEVIPVLTKAGCNSGKCHGSPSGKGGFAISLRGFDWTKDYHRLTREAFGRRIDFLQPAESLLLAKPTLRLPHGGGRRLNAEDPLTRLLIDWVADGAPLNADDRPAIALEMVPSERWLDSSQDAQQIRVVARFADGSSRDVTHLAHYASSPEGKAEVSAGGLVRKLADGEVTVAASFGEQFATSRLAFLRPAEGFAWPDPQENNQIDRLVFDRLRRLRIAPSELCDDATFLRRAWLDLCGLLPPNDEVRRFLADDSPDKRARLVDELLERPQYADFWGMKWSDRLGCNQRFVGKTGAIKYHAWIRHQIEANVPEDEFARRLVTASGGNYGNPPAGFYRLPRTPEDRAEQVAQVFLGVRIGCARCHNHPGERWTQDDYYGLAAFFARLRYRDGPFFNHIYDKEETIVPLRSGELAHARTGLVMQPKPLGAPTEPIPLEADRREKLADWLVSPDNPFFARAAVNRIWGHLFGRGIVEPVDDFRSSNPPAHPELLDWLATDFASHGFDRKRLIRQIMRSRVYQLAATTNPSNAEDDRYFSHASVRLLGAEQLLDAIAQATGTAEKFGGFPSGLRAVQLPDGEYAHRFLSAFGRPARAIACACERDSESNLGQALELVGGEQMEVQIRSPNGRVAGLLARGANGASIVEELFLATVSRFPTDVERAELSARLDGSSDRRAAAEDLMWALLNHQEFLFQH